MLWNECLTSCHNIMVLLNRIIDNPETTDHERGHLASQLLDCVQVKRELLSDPTIIMDVMNAMKQIRQNTIEIVPNQTRHLLQSEMQHRAKRSRTAATGRRRRRRIEWR